MDMSQFVTDHPKPSTTGLVSAIIASFLWIIIHGLLTPEHIEQYSKLYQTITHQDIEKVMQSKQVKQAVLKILKPYDTISIK